MTMRDIADLLDERITRLDAELRRIQRSAPARQAWDIIDQRREDAS